MNDGFRTRIDIEAPIEQVFDHFVRPELIVRWMGDVARLEATKGGVFSVDINGVSIRGHFVRVERPTFLEIAWGEAGNERMPPGSTRLTLSFEARGTTTLVHLSHTGLGPDESHKHAIGWPHFLERLAVSSSGGDPGPDPWKTTPPSASV